MEYYKNLDFADIKYFCEIDHIEKVEQWLSIYGYEDTYMISDLGRVKSLSGLLTTKVGVVKPRRLRIMSQTIKSNGYLSIMFSVNSNQKRFHVHRLVAIAFIPNPENKPEVNHKDCDKKNNAKWNVEWNTIQENTDHAVVNNLVSKGESSYSSKLTELNIIAIRRLCRINPKFNKSRVAKKLGVRDTTIHKIIKGQRWKHLL